MHLAVVTCLVRKKVYFISFLSGNHVIIRITVVNNA